MQWVNPFLFNSYVKIPEGTWRSPLKTLGVSWHLDWDVPKICHSTGGWVTLIFLNGTRVRYETHWNSTGISAQRGKSDAINFPQIIFVFQRCFLNHPQNGIWHSVAHILKKSPAEIVSCSYIRPCSSSTAKAGQTKGGMYNCLTTNQIKDTNKSIRWN